MNKFFKHSLTLSFSIITVIFTFVPESVFDTIHIIKDAPTETNIICNRIVAFVAVFITVAIVYSFYLHFRKKINIKGKNYNIIVRYGDIFNMTDCKKVIPFDECFSTSVGAAPSQIKPGSICGQYLNKYPITDMQDLLGSAQIKPISGKSKYNSQAKYESGCLIPKDDCLLMAFAKLDKDGLGEMTREEYLDCLEVLWQEINKHYGLSDVCIPILGSGITRMGDNSLTQQELLDMIIASYKLSKHKIKSPAKLHIVCQKRDDFSLNKIGQYI